jgi:hypothetical protein
MRDLADEDRPEASNGSSRKKEEPSFCEGRMVSRGRVERCCAEEVSEQAYSSMTKQNI